MSLKRKNPTQTPWEHKKERVGSTGDPEIDINLEDTIEVDVPVDFKEEIDPLSAVRVSFSIAQAVKTEFDEHQSENSRPAAVIEGYAVRNIPQTPAEGGTIEAEEEKPNLNSLACNVSSQNNPCESQNREIPQNIQIKLEDDEEGLEVVDLTGEIITYSKRGNSPKIGAAGTSYLRMLLQGQNLKFPNEIDCAVPKRRTAANGASASTPKKRSAPVNTGNDLSPVDDAAILDPITQFNSEDEVFGEALEIPERPQGSSQMFSLDDWETTDHDGPESVSDLVVSCSPITNPPVAPRTCVQATSSKCTSEEPKSFSAEAFAPVSVKHILDHPISSGFWTADQENEILSQVIPLSRWDRTTVYNPEHIFFSDFDFSQFPWLCDSPELKKFYCWPCLLCGNQALPWSMDMAPSPSAGCCNDFEEAFTDHQVTLLHLNSQTIYESRKALVNPLKVIRNVEKIQMLWRDLVQTLCSERKKNERFKLENDPALTAHIQKIMVEIFHKRMSPTSAFQLSSKILGFALQHIKSKIAGDARDSPYLTLHIEDLASFVEDRSWFVVIARYTDKSGCVQEKVLDFVRSTLSKLSRTAESVIRWLRPLFVDNKFKGNVVGFSHSASLVVPKDISKFHNLIMSVCPRAMFYHPPGQHLFRSIFQAISHLAECRRYFREIKDMCEFINKNPSVMQYKSETFFTRAPLPSRFDITLAATLKMHYSALLTIFQRMVNLCKCSPEQEAQAKKFVRFLQCPKDRILIVLIGLICSTCAEFAAALDRPSDVGNLTDCRAKAIKILKSILAQGLKGINETADDPTLAKVVYDVSQKYVHLFNNVVQMSVDFLTQTFENLEHFTYTKPELLKFPLKLTKYPIQSPDFAARAKLSKIQSDQLKFFTLMPSPPQFRTLNHTQLFNHLSDQTQTKEYAGLYAFLQFVHTVAANNNERRLLLSSVREFVAKAPAGDVTSLYISGYSWKIDSTVFSSIMNDPELFETALNVSNLKLVVENDYDVKIVEYYKST